MVADEESGGAPAIGAERTLPRQTRPRSALPPGVAAPPAQRRPTPTFQPPDRPPAWPGTPFEPPGAFGLSQKATALLAAVCSLVLVIACLAAGVPWWLQRQAHSEWSATRVALPSAVAGLDRNLDAPIEAMLGTTLRTAGLAVSEAAGYGPLSRGIVVVVAHRWPESADPAAQAAGRDAFVEAFRAQGAAVRLSQREAGPLGGWFGCGVTPNGLTTCVATDRGALVIVMAGPSVKDPREVAREARAAAVSRD